MQQSVNNRFWQPHSVFITLDSTASVMVAKLCEQQAELETVLIFEHII